MERDFWEAMLMPKDPAGSTATGVTDLRVLSHWRLHEWVLTVLQ